MLFSIILKLKDYIHTEANKQYGEIQEKGFSHVHIYVHAHTCIHRCKYVLTPQG